MRELPATHFQPCYCCLCRPPSGVRPSLRVAGVDVGRDRVYLKFEDEGAFPADEYEKVDPPTEGRGSAAGAGHRPGSRALIRDLKDLAEQLARDRQA